MSLEEFSYWLIVYNHAIVTALINAVTALSIYFSLRAGIFNLSAVGFMAIGAYTAGILSTRFGLPSVVGITAGIALALVLGAVLVYPVLKLRGHYLAIATLSFAAIVQAMAMNLDSLTNGPSGLLGVPATVRAWHVVIVLAVLLYIACTLQKSRTGRAWDAIRTDVSAARAMGIDVEAYRLKAFLISTAVAALAGGLWAHVNRVVVPFEFGFVQLTMALVNTLLGGISTPFGPVLGALVVTSMPDWLAGFAEYREMIIGALLVVIVVYLPNGLIDPLVLLGRRIGLSRGAAAGGTR
ncbi:MULTISPECIES: branched-chain amino acid ABC transporter permease [unclassified Chelatococcus]|uniref:branched-chain amino acid ABC transporter permease n=1 Tax=unclassified Chelatococcus TaxID=2638111 RepID=UPI001BD082D1|nr:MULTISPECIES: branched-chain amino acid ABC transporter permease [unclassified Chelatococcus]MBS7700623.1 branched-chain amino acid ABC transporter permease [Chelatococcus sp. YT9]MBX3559054.1 branched-chain amino acid ABC transporter permease [Chelatococcus sp.]